MGTIDQGAWHNRHRLTRPGPHESGYRRLRRLFRLRAAGNDEQQALSAGTMRAALSITESQSGSDVSGIRTRATKVGGGFRLNGSKIWCTNSDVADFVLVAACTQGEDKAAQSINLFIPALSGEFISPRRCDAPEFVVDCPVVNQ